MDEIKTQPRLTSEMLRAMIPGEERWFRDCWPKEAQSMRSLAYNNSTKERRYVVNYFGQDRALRVFCQENSESAL